MRRAPLVALDCRWIGLGGAGTVTEGLLASLRTLPRDRPVDWRFWDPARARTGAPIRLVPHPTAWLGQAYLLDQPRAADLVCFMHQIRPLVAARNVTVIHDTTPLRYASRTVAALKRRFLQRVARTSAAIITVSEWSARRLVDDLRVPEEAVSVIPNVVSPALSDRVRSERELSGPGDYALHVGGLAPHKNVDRLVSAFTRSQFRRDGGRLVLTGCQKEGIASLSESLNSADRAAITFLRRCPQADLDHLYAGARFVVQPSLEEGFGLPAREALSAGLPVVGSPAGALAEVSAQFLECFDPRSVDEMAGALDAAARRTERFDIEEERARAARFARTAPRLEEYAPLFERVFAGALA